jgi:hypothetical protein
MSVKGSQVPADGFRVKIRMTGIAVSGVKQISGHNQNVFFLHQRLNRQPGAEAAVDVSGNEQFHATRVMEADGLSGWGGNRPGVDSVPQFSRTFECDHAPGRQCHFLVGCRISALSGFFFIDTEFAESADHDIFTTFDGGFDDFQKFLHHLIGGVSGEVQSCLNLFGDNRFGQGHMRSLLKKHV